MKQKFSLMVSLVFKAYSFIVKNNFFIVKANSFIDNLYSYKTKKITTSYPMRVLEGLHAAAPAGKVCIGGC
jgi:hypothetical protein